MINKITVTLLLLLILSGQFSFGQKIKWAKYDKLPFKEDTISGFISRNYNKKFQIPPYDITESKAIFEIRAIPLVPPRLLPITILQFYKDSTIWSEYYEIPDLEVQNLIKKYKDSSAEVYGKVMTPILEKTGGTIWKLVRKRIPASEAKKMIAELTERKLFTIDINEEIASAEKKVNTNPNYSKIIQNNKIYIGPLSRQRASEIEIKYKNKYRVFRTGSVLFYYQGEHEIQIVEQFQIGADLTNYLIPNYQPKK